MFDTLIAPLATSAGEGVVTATNDLGEVITVTQSPGAISEEGPTESADTGANPSVTGHLDEHEGM